MKASCDEERWSYVGDIMRGALGPEAQPCGRVYDDLVRSTICPHELLGTEGLICEETDLFVLICPHCKKLEQRSSPASG